MSKAIHHVPEGLTAVIPQIVVTDGKALIDFATKAFDAYDVNVMPGPDGKGIMHGFFRIGGDPIFICDLPGFTEPTKAQLMIYVPDVDSCVSRAVAAGATVRAPVEDQFWGDRWGLIVDPFGNYWQVATHKENVTPEEMQRRMAALPKK